MKKLARPRIITAELIGGYADFLREQERSTATIQKYIHDTTALCDYMAGEPLTKTAMIAWKEALTAHYAPVSVNTMLAAVQCGRAALHNKGKRRTIFLPENLRLTLKKYMVKQQRTVGCVFVTKSEKPLDRSNIWRDMKALCDRANVAAEKVFPHNLRHLFARTYYALEKDLSRLADILGHSSVNTTRIYTIESGSVHIKQMERMGLVIT